MKKTHKIIGLSFLGLLFLSFKSGKSEIYTKSLNASKKTFGVLTSTQIDSLKHIVNAFHTFGDKDLNKLAYIIATAWHESKLKPIKEIRASSGTTLYNTQNAYWYSGYYGRGFVQLTWKANYQKMSDFLGINLVDNPDLALNPKYAAQILVYGMMKGSFTGKKLSDYINPGSSNDFYNARKIVNGLDRAMLINDLTIDLIINS